MERLTASEITVGVLTQFTPVWIGLAVILTVSWLFRSRLGLYGKLYSSPIGVAGLILVLFWVLTAIFADLIATMDPLTQISGMKNKKPGWPGQSAGNCYCTGRNHFCFHGRRYAGATGRILRRQVRYHAQFSGKPGTGVSGYFVVLFTRNT